jgi:1-acyl-sn-glycerol-3-phosphate acyltransferase/long-chain acyl-CoA synthetase
MDSVALMIAAGRTFERFGMLAAMDYFFDNTTRRLFLNQFMTLIPIKRHPKIREVVQTIDACRRFIHNNDRGIIIFPEGTRSTSGEMLPFKKGAAMIAIELGIPAVPAYIKGTGDAMPKGRGWIRPGKIYVHIGEAITPNVYVEGLTNGRFNKSYRYLTRDLEKRVHSLREVAGCEN